MITIYALQYGINPSIAISIAKIESNFKENAIGMYGELGIFQILPKYSKHPPKKLLKIHVNIEEGIKKLKEAENKCKHYIDNTWIICYNLGIEGGSKVKHPKAWKYYKKFIKEYNKLIEMNEEK